MRVSICSILHALYRTRTNTQIMLALIQDIHKQYPTYLYPTNTRIMYVSINTRYSYTISDLPLSNEHTNNVEGQGKARELVYITGGCCRGSARINVTTIWSCPCPGRRMTSQYGLQGLSILDSQHETTNSNLIHVKAYFSKKP
jgi:hypothetical protein